MAQIAQRLPENAEGDLFVDASCIDCDACRQIAPAVFREHHDQSIVYQQPRTPEELQRALMALVACPTASIGTVSKRSARAAVDA
ncbi:MAG TPA: ferredoxin, partial [Anaerolineales bacterium]